MKTADADRRLMLERFADGELGESERAEIDALLAADAGAREYLESLSELRAILPMAIDAAAEHVDFSGLFDRVAARLSVPERSAAMDRQVIAFADAQPMTSAERSAVSAYVDAYPEAKAAFNAVRDLGELVRAPVDAATDVVDFAALARRIDEAIEREVAVSAPARAVAPRRAWWLAALDFIGGPRALLASGVAAAAVFVVVRPGTEPGAPTEPVQIHNHYYELPVAEGVAYDFDSIQKGFQGTYQPEDKVLDTAPVFWIAPQQGGATAPADDFQKEPATDPDAGNTTETSL